MRVAFTTCALLVEPYGVLRTVPFEELTPTVYSASEEHPGFIERADYADDREDLEDIARDWGKWGPLQLPFFYDGGVTEETYRAAQTLSLWRDLPDVWNFVYSGIHASALRRRHEWFLRPAWPTYAIWWVADDHTPTWAEAIRKLELLHASGATSETFSLKQAFDQDGRAVTLGKIAEPGLEQAGERRSRGTQPA